MSVYPPWPEALERLKSIAPGGTTEADCRDQLDGAATANTMDLFYGYAVCAAAGMPTEGAFLLSAGQIRSLVDMSIMKPAGEADKETVSLLYFAIFYSFGGAGPPEVLSTREFTDRLFAMLEAWAPEYGPGYDPGWRVADRPSDVEYSRALAASKTRRFDQLKRIVVLYADEEYVSLQRQLAELEKRVGGTFVAGTPEEGQFQDLMRKINARAKELRSP
jgi:hypothetical protein